MTIRLLAALVVLAATLGAQVGNSPALDVTISPNPAPAGATITITCNDPTNGGLFTPLGCLVSGIHAGSPGGPVVSFFPCTFLGQPIPPCGQPPRTQTWTQSVQGGGTAAPGDYWVEIQSSVGPFGSTTPHFFPLTILGSQPEPVLEEAGPPTPGSYYTLDFSSDFSYGGDTYFGAVSGTTDVGLALGNEHLGLDQDFIFGLSFPSPDPLIFQGFQGVIDGFGDATLGILVPALPPGTCIPLHAQVLVLRATGGFELSNVVHFSFDG